MSLLKTIQMFVAQNPGLTNKQIAAALTEYDIQSVQRAVCRLVDTKRATRKHAGKCYRYYAEPPADCHFEVFEPTPEVSALMETAKCVESKGLFHRAATIRVSSNLRSGAMVIALSLWQGDTSKEIDSLHYEVLSGWPPGMIGAGELFVKTLSDMIPVSEPVPADEEKSTDVVTEDEPISAEKH